MLYMFQDWKKKRESTGMAHPGSAHSRAHLHEPTTMGERVAERLAAVVGSWKFIIWQNVLVGLWIIFNIVAIFGFHADPYPFILLNLIFSWQASNTGPVLQMTGNRSAERDRRRDDHEAKEVDELFKIQVEQVTILNQQTEILNLLRGRTDPPPPPKRSHKKKEVPPAPAEPATHHPDLSPLIVNLHRESVEASHAQSDTP